MLCSICSCVICDNKNYKGKSPKCNWCRKENSPFYDGYIFIPNVKKNIPIKIQQADCEYEISLTARVVVKGEQTSLSDLLEKAEEKYNTRSFLVGYMDTDCSNISQLMEAPF